MSADSRDVPRAPLARAPARAAALVLLAVVLLAGAGCGDEEPRTPAATGAATETTAAPEREEETAQTQRCTNQQAGYSVDYPAEWHTNPGDVVATCSFFDPEPIQVPERQDVAGLAAISIRREPVAFSRVTGGDPGTRVIERDELEIAGRPAVRRLTEATGEALLPEGRRGYQYLVDLDGETLFATTSDSGDRDFSANRDRLDEMMRSLELQGS